MRKSEKNDPKSTSLSFAKVVQLYLSILVQIVGFVWCGVCGVDDDGNSDGDADGDASG